MPISEAHSQAARINGFKSKGPKTQFGRDRSAANAVKHGMTGSGKFLPDALKLEVEGEVAMYEALYKVRTPGEARLLEVAALNGVRWHHLMKETLTVAAARKAHAHKHYDEMRHDAVDRLMDRLANQPRKALPLLVRTSEGCGALAHGWTELREAMALDGWLDSEETLRMLNLLGYAKEPTKSVELGLVAMLAALRILRRANDPNAPADDQPAPSAESVAEATAFVVEVIEGYQQQYRNLARELWENVDKDVREAAPDLVQVDHSPEGLRRARYMREADRLRRHALDELHRLRRGGAEPRPVATKAAAPSVQGRGMNPSSAPSKSTPAPPSRPAPPPPPAKSATPAPAAPSANPSKSLPPFPPLKPPANGLAGMLSGTLPITAARSSAQNEPRPSAPPTVAKPPEGLPSGTKPPVPGAPPPTDGR